MGDVLDGASRPRSSGRLLTVGIPVFNGKALLRRCLESVVSSSLPRHRFEIVVADDASTAPETRAILQEFRTRLAGDPGFFRVLSSRTNSGGAARPRNRILAAATGEYVFFVDSDDTIGELALERIAEAVATTPADWIALNQVPVNGRGALCVIRQPHTEVPRARALSTLTVHKVFRRAEIERQRLRFDERLPSGQDVSFAFSYLLNASRFLMLGSYDYYYLTQHGDDPDEPAHLSRRAGTPRARIAKNERILRSMLAALRTSALAESEKRKILGQVCLPRILLQEGYLRAIVSVGPRAGNRPLRRLARLLADPLVAGIDPADLKGRTGEHLAVVAGADWKALAALVSPTTPPPSDRPGPAAKWVGRGRRVVDGVTGRARHRRLLAELTRLRRSVEDVRATQSRLEAQLDRLTPSSTVVVGEDGEARPVAAERLT